MILQGKESVFEIDSIYPLLQQLRCFSKPLPVEIEGLILLNLKNIGGSPACAAIPDSRWRSTSRQGWTLPPDAQIGP